MSLDNHKDGIINLLKKFLSIKIQQLNINKNCTTKFANACKTIHQYYKNKQIYYQKIFLDHDGYDLYGPKSDIWDIIFLRIEKDKLYLDIWHAEDWFDNDFKFELDKSVELKTIENINKLLMMIIENQIYTNYGFHNYIYDFDEKDKKSFIKKYPKNYYMGSINYSNKKQYLSLYKKEDELYYLILN